MTDTGTPFADGDDPDDAWNATDPVVQLLTLLRRRLTFAIARHIIGGPDVTDRLLSIADDLDRIRDRIEDGDL